jgi:transcriptional regulator with XRE-family HTH domain
VVALGVSKVPNFEFEDLPSYVIRIRRQKNITLQQMIDRAESVGIHMAGEMLEDLANGASDNPTIDTLRGIASGLDEPLTDVLAAAFQLRRENPLTRRITLRQTIWDKLSDDASHCHRTLEEQLTEILTGFYNMRSVAVNHSAEACNHHNRGFLIKPESDTQKLINPIKVSEKLKEIGHQITAQTVLMVLSKMNQNVDAETIRVTVSMAKQMYPDIVEITE